ncbi:MAG: HAD family hydrolase, partial [Kovacikia sp.]
NDAHAQAWVEAFADYGYDIPFATVRPLMGMGGDHIIPKLLPGLKSGEGTGQSISERRKELVLNKYCPHVLPANGSRELIEKLRDRGLHLIVASSASQQELDVLLEIAHVKDLLSEITSSNDAASSKPAPDIVRAALKKAQLDPEKTVMLGDTPYDIEAANQVGVGVIAFRCGGFSDEQLSQAIAIYNDPADLLLHYDQSPLVGKGDYSLPAR